MTEISSYPKLDEVKTIEEIIDEIVESRVNHSNGAAGELISIFNNADPKDFQEREIIVDESAALCYKSTLDALERRRAEKRDVDRAYKLRKKASITPEEKEQKREKARQQRLARIARMTEEERNLLREKERQKKRRKAQNLRKRKTKEEMELIHQRRRKNKRTYRLKKRAMQIMNANGASSIACTSNSEDTDSQDEIEDKALKPLAPKEEMSEQATEEHLKMELLKEGSCGN